MPKCSQPDCEREQFCLELCRGHYARQQRGVPVAGPLRDVRRGNTALVCRMPATAVAALKAQAAAQGVSPNKLAVRLLMNALGIKS